MIGRGLAAMLAVLLSVSVISVLHRALDGALLANRVASVLVLLGLFGVCMALAWRVRKRAGSPPVPVGVDPVSLAIALGGALLVVGTYWGGETGIGGDYRMHRMYAYQLLNGFSETHEPYSGVAGHYPPLVHTLLALGVHVTGLTVHYVMLVGSCAISIGVAIVAARVGREIGLGAIGARFFAALLIAWGGAWVFELRAFQLYLPAVQLAMPFLSRNLALLLVLLVVFVGLQAEKRRLLPLPAALAAGGLVGMLGLTRPWEFGFGLGALLLVAIARRSREALLAIVVALLVSSIYWLPLVLDWLELGIHASREVIRRADLPSSPFLYLPLLPLLAVAAVDRREMPASLRTVAGIFLALLALPLAARVVAVLGIGEYVGLQGGLVKLERIGQLLALSLFGLAGFGLDRVAARWGRGVAAGIGFAFVALGAVTTLRATGYFLDGRVLFPSPRWSQPAQYVSDLAGSPFYFRHLLDEPRTVVLAPSAFGHMTASRNGVDVGYSHQAAPIWRDSPSGSRSPEVREREMDAFYALLERGAVDGRALEAYGARHFIWTKSSPGALPNVTHVGKIGRFQGVTWHLHRVDGFSKDGR